MIVYTPRYENNRKFDDYEAHNEPKVFAREEDCEQWIFAQGFTRKIKGKKDIIYIDENNYQRIIDKAEEIAAEQDSKVLDLEYAINDSIYSCPSYVIIEQEYIKDIEYEKTKEKAQEIGQNVVDTSKQVADTTVKVAKDLKGQWNKSDFGKNTNKFLSSLANKTKKMITDEPEKPIETITTENFINEIDIYYDVEETPTDIIVFKNGDKIATVSKDENYKVEKEEMFDHLRGYEQNNLDYLFNIYAQTPINIRSKTVLKGFKIDSIYLSDETKSTLFESRELAENFVNKIKKSIEIKNTVQ